MEVSVTYFCNKVFDFYLCPALWMKSPISWCLVQFGIFGTIHVVFVFTYFNHSILVIIVQLESLAVSCTIPVTPKYIMYLSDVSYLNKGTFSDAMNCKCN